MLPYRTRWLTFLFALGFGAMALTGCRNADNRQPATDTPAATAAIIRGTAALAKSSTPETTTAIGPGSVNLDGTFNLGIIPDLVDPEPGVLGYVSVSQLIVTGRVVEALPAQWTTVDGKRPDNPNEVVPQMATIVTPFIIPLDGSPIVNRTSESLASGQIIALINGGIVGDDSVTIHLPWMRLTVGERVLITLDANPTWLNPPGPIMTSDGPGWWFTMKWTLTEDGQAVAYFETRDTADVVAEFREAVEFLNPRTPPTEQTKP